MKRLSSLVFSLALTLSLFNAPITVRAEEAEPNEETPTDVIAEEETESESEIQAEEDTAEKPAAEAEQEESAVPAAAAEEESTDPAEDEETAEKNGEILLQAAEDTEITEAAAAADFEEPRIGRLLKHPVNLSVEKNPGYMSPSEYSASMSGQGIGDTDGVIFIGTIGNPETRYTWNGYQLYNGVNFYYQFSLFAKDGYIFTNNTAVTFNGRTVDQISVADDGKSLTAYVQYSMSDEGDVTPPVLLSVELDKTEVDAGGKLLVTVHAEDDISMATQIYICFRSSSGDKYLYANPINYYWDESIGEYIEYP